MTKKAPAPNDFLKALILLNTLTIAANAFLMPLWSIFVKHIGGDVRTAGYALFIFSIIIGFFTFIAAKLEHKAQNEEFMLVVTAALLCVAYSTYYFVTTPWQLYMVQLVLGLIYAFQCPAMYSLFHRYVPIDSATWHWGLWNGFYNIGVGCAALISALAFYYGGFNAVFLLLVATACVSLVLTIMVITRMKLYKNSH